MIRLKRTVTVILIIFAIAIIPVQGIQLFPSVVAEAHSGRTDSNGGHKDNKNKSGLGSYHYHCGGYPAHLHKNGVCPYTTKGSTSKETATKKSSKSETNQKSSMSTKSTKDLVKKVQKALNKLGYDCGKVDGVKGKKTIAALKGFQKDNDLEVDGVIGNQVKKALNIID